MAQDAAKLRLLQANLESVVGQLDMKTKEAEAASQEAATQKALVQQITKKLDVCPSHLTPITARVALSMLSHLKNEMFWRNW